MKISKVLIIIAVAVLTTFLFSTVALAGGWHKLGPKEGNDSPPPPGNPPGTFNPDAGLWTSESGGITARIPHYGLSSSSNNCRTCHAVHNADNIGKGLGVDLNGDGDDTDANEVGLGQAFKLLRNETRATECNFCHGAIGALSDPIKKPYADMLDGLGNRIPPKGQHTLGAKAIPDSTITSGNSIFTDGLSCGNCHSVHGGWTLNDVPNSGKLGTRILRRDPANNGDRQTGGAASGVANVASQGGSNPDNTSGANEPIKDDNQANDATINESQLLAAFCGDCHNKNVNWSTGGSGSVGDVIGVSGANEGTRPNRYGHPLGDIDGLIDIYGKLGRVESVGVNDAIKAGPVANDNRMSCDDCHKSRQVTPSKFPHQSIGHKLLSNAYTDTSTILDGSTQRDTWDTSSNPAPADDSYTGKPDRPLPELDVKVCRTCHGTDGTYPGIGVPGDSGSF